MHVRLFESVSLIRSGQAKAIRLATHARTQNSRTHAESKRINRNVCSQASLYFPRNDNPRAIFNIRAEGFCPRAEVTGDLLASTCRRVNVNGSQSRTRTRMRMRNKDKNAGLASSRSFLRSARAGRSAENDDLSVSSALVRKDKKD
jgi:hypothetical protein